MLQHAMTWVHGELFEMRLIIGAGVLLALAALALHYFGTGAYARGMAWPITALAAFVLVLGVSLYASNLRRLSAWPERIAHDEAALLARSFGFAKTERARADEFIAWYPRTRLIAAGLGVLALGLLLYAEPGGLGGPTPRPRLFGWGFALLLAVVFVFAVDHFSEERARVYRAGLEDPG